MMWSGGSLLLFAVGLKLKGKSDHEVVEGEDALIAALKAKTQSGHQGRPGGCPLVRH
jgi:hypothetical protein